MTQTESVQDRSPVPVSVQTSATHNKQYTLKRILGLWAVATLPMALLAWVVAPALISRVKLPYAILSWLIITLGMPWQLGVSLWAVRREEGNLRWETIRHRVWLNTPRHPRTGQPHARLFWWLLPCLFVALISLVLEIFLTSLVPLPLLHWHSYAFAGQWWLVGLALISWVLSVFFAEEFLFRGVLLPKMQGMFGKWDWAMNAALYAIYHLHRPWMIPLRLIDSLVIAWPARRFRSNWMAVIVHSVEGVGLLALVVMGVMSPPLEPLPTPLTFPQISRRPIPVNYERGVTPSLPTHDPDSDEIWQVDLRSYDLSALDLRDASNDLFYANFDSRTLWPPDDRMHPGFDPEQILELGKNPGLGLRRLHAQGITGRGTGIAIIDLPLLTEHQEYADQLQWYEEIVTYPFEVEAEMHGAAVASIAVGKTVGVAPEASLYYIASGYPYMPFHHDGEGVRRILQINEQLPENQKIRVISISCYCDFPDVIAEEAKAAGMLIVCSSIEEVHGFKFHGLGRSPLADPDIFESYEPGMFWAERFYADGHRFSDHLLVPMDSRTTASPTGIDEYAFYRHGGVSWSIPYIAGVYALAAQVDPTITPGRFWSLALETGRTIDIEHEGQMFTLDKILDPVALINTLQND